MNFWLFKSEPDEFSIDDLKRKQTEPWTGIRNYQARNYLRDDVKIGDEVLFYHSSCKPTQIVGLAKVVKEAYTDPLAFDPKSPYFDPKSDPVKPRWVCVDLAFVEKFARSLTLDFLRSQKELQNMVLLQSSRLSIQPVQKTEMEHILKLAR